MLPNEKATGQNTPVAANRPARDGLATDPQAHSNEHELMARVHRMHLLSLSEDTKSILPLGAGVNCDLTRITVQIQGDELW